MWNFIFLVRSWSFQNCNPSLSDLGGAFFHLAGKIRVSNSMGTERKRKVSLFDVVDDAAAKLVKSNGGAANNSLINHWNARPYSQRYFDILEKRKTLPVWHQKEDFLLTLRNNQTLILVGETGSGKTTQVCSFGFSFC